MESAGLRVCTQAFDELVLLKRGGRTIYYGPTGHQSAELVSYFESVRGVPRIEDGTNPATWMLEVARSCNNANAASHPCHNIVVTKRPGLHSI